MSYVQARRIACSHCHEFFTYLVTGQKSGNTAGIHLLTSGDWMKRNALHSARLKIVGLARRRHLGLARCPYCHRYQRWMCTARSVRRLIRGFLWGLPAGLLVLVIGQELLELHMPTDVRLTLLAGTAVGMALIGWITTPGTTPKLGAEDSAVLKDDALDALLGEAPNAEEPDPFLRLARNLDPGLGKAPRIALGLVDQTKRPRHPEWDSASRVDELADRKADLGSHFGFR